jgi:hypothetical protein
MNKQEKFLCYGWFWLNAACSTENDFVNKRIVIEYTLKKRVEFSLTLSRLFAFGEVAGSI